MPEYSQRNPVFWHVLRIVTQLQFWLLYHKKIFPSILKSPLFQGYRGT